MILMAAARAILMVAGAGAAAANGGPKIPTLKIAEVRYPASV